MANCEQFAMVIAVILRRDNIPFPETLPPHKEEGEREGVVMGG